MKQISLTICGLLLCCAMAGAQDANRAGNSAAKLEFPLKAAWVSREMQPPTPSFRDSVVRRAEAKPGKAMAAADLKKLSVYHRQGLADPASYDFGPHPVVAADRVYVGSSTDEAMLCLESATGKRLWTFRPEGPIRFAPVVADASVFLCSDDGSVYCLDAVSGEKRWQQRIAPRTGFALNNGRLMSAWPVRGGLAYDGGRVYCAAGIFPEQGTYLSALDAASGKPVWTRQVDNVINGRLFVDGQTLWTPTHRTTPCQFNLADGKPKMENLPTLLSRGAAQIWRIDQLVAWGPDEGELIYLQLSPETKGAGAKMKRGVQSPLGVVSPLHGWCAVAGPTHFALVQDDRVLAVEIAKFRKAVADRLAAVDSEAEPPADLASYGKLMGSIAAPDAKLVERLEKNSAWTAKLPTDASCRIAVVAGESLVLGGLKSLRALDLRTGAEQWKAEVDAQVRSLVVEDGALYAGTESGTVYCFSRGAVQPREIAARRVPADDSAFAEAAKLAIARAGRDKGICLVAGGGTGKLASAVAQRSRFNVVILESDPARAAAQREYLDAAGLYGNRVVVRHETGAGLAGYPVGLANLIVSEEAFETGRLPYPATALLPLLQPYTGVIVVGARQGAPDLAAWQGSELAAWQAAPGAPGEWRFATRGALPGGGQWPTANGSSGNSMCSEESHVPAAGSSLRLQWFGEPFAGDIFDRHLVPMTPLFKNGIAVILGLSDTLIAQDAYNGTILWRLQVPGIERVLASHNSSPMTFSEDGRWVFALAGDECLQFDAVTGHKKAALKGTAPGDGWGYVGPCGANLIGSSQGKMDFASTDGRQVAALTDWSASSPAASHDLFATDIASGRKLWTYSEGLILNPSIAINDGRIYFAQSGNAAARANRAGNMKMGDWIAKDATGGAEIVALDAATGKPLWRMPITRDLDAASHWIMYLTATGDTLLVTRTMFKREGDASRRGYDFELLDAKTGKSRWTRWLPGQSTSKHAGLGYGKNSLSARPIIIGDRFYIRASLDTQGTKGLVFALNLRDGQNVVQALDTGTQDAGCSVALGSLNALYYRDYKHAVLEVATGNRFLLSNATRPSCWPNTLPVGGIVFAPEGGAGCSCGLSYQVSFALAPAADAPPAKPIPPKGK